MDDLNKRFEQSIKKRDQLVAEKNKFDARLEVAIANYEALIAECRSKNIDPDNIDTVIEDLTKRYEELVLTIEGEVSALSVALSPILSESK